MIRRHVFGILVCLCCFGAGAMAIPMQQYYRGKIEAYRDISLGTYRGWRCAYHFDPKPTEHFDQLMLKYANFRIETTNDCTFKNRGYTGVQMARLNRLYPGVFERALNETIEWQRHRLESMGQLTER
jgi:hypothetical protein